MPVSVQLALEVARAVEELSAVLVGGQALNLWAEVFALSTPELSDYGPYTSKDIDFLGTRAIAAKLASRLRGTVDYPDLETDPGTPNSAIVRVQAGGMLLEIDFLHHTLGLPSKGEQHIDLTVVVEEGGAEQAFTIRVLHPVYCMITRINNIMHPAMRRNDSLAYRQLSASLVVIRRYIEERLHSEEHKNVSDACKCFSLIHNFLLKDMMRRKCHKATNVDPLALLKHFQFSEALDLRYRERTLDLMIARIENRRAAWAARQPVGSAVDSEDLGVP